jgi:GNAT superfamily N-acetyltransferase
VQIIEIDTTNRSLVKRFVNLPFKLYQDCPQWVPQLRDEALLQLDRRRNPYYKRSDATFFLAERDGQDVGRICVMNPRYYNEFKKTSQAFFYLFECVDDQTVATALFNAASRWAIKRNLTLIRGPLGFMAADGFGMLAKGFEHCPAIGIPYNHPYYPGLAEGWGFELEERVYSGHIDVPTMQRAFPQRVLDVAEKVKKRYDFRIKNFKTKRELRRWVAPRLAELYNRTLTHIAGDPPLPPELIEVLTENLLLISDPKLHKFIVKGDEIVGFLFCFVNISEGLQKAKGRLLPFGWFHILREFKRTNRLDLNGMGIVPEYQGLGGPALMYAELYHTLKDNRQFEHAEVIQISEFNAQSLNELKKFGVDFYKTHHIYRKELVAGS